MSKRLSRAILLFSGIFVFVGAGSLMFGVGSYQGNIGIIALGFWYTLVAIHTEMRAGS